MAFCISIGGQTQYRNGERSDEILVGTMDGVVTLKRPSPDAPWEEAGRSLAGSHVSTLLIEPKNGAVLAGTHGDGIHLSEDGGKSWARSGAGLESDDLYSMNYVQDGDAVRIYAGTAPAYLYVSTDLGRSWEELPSLRSIEGRDAWTFPGDQHIAHVKTIAFDPRSADSIYLGVEVGGGFKSTDRGRTWRRLDGFSDDVHRMVVTAERPDAVYMSNGDGVFFSASGGEDWERRTGRDARIAYPDGLVVHPEQPDLVFTSGSIMDPGAWRKSHDADARIGRSRDGGRTWEYLEGGLPAHIRGNVEALSMHVWSGGFELAAGTTDGEVFYSEDGGNSWQTIASGLAPVSKGGHYRHLQAEHAG